jgi:hypothetical protein
LWPTFSHHLARAQDGGAITEHLDLLQFVADVENGAALGGQPPEHGKEPLDRLRGQNRGGFIQNKELGVLEQTPQNLHPLTLSHRQVVNKFFGLDLKAVARGCLQQGVGSRGG